MAKPKGAHGPLTLRCPRCGARNVGKDKPIRALGEYSFPMHRRGRTKIYTGVECGKCRHAWQTTHQSVRLPVRKDYA